MGATSKSKRKRWNKLTKQTKECSHCPPHKGENAKKKPRSDKYKSKRKGR